MPASHTGHVNGHATPSPPGIPLSATRRCSCAHVTHTPHEVEHGTWSHCEDGTLSSRHTGHSCSDRDRVAVSSAVFTSPSCFAGTLALVDDMDDPMLPAVGLRPWHYTGGITLCAAQKSALIDI